MKTEPDKTDGAKVKGVVEALEEAEAGLQCAVSKLDPEVLAKSGFIPSEALALKKVQAALATLKEVSAS